MSLSFRRTRKQHPIIQRAAAITAARPSYYISNMRNGAVVIVHKDRLPNAQHVWRWFCENQKTGLMLGRGRFKGYDSRPEAERAAQRYWSRTLIMLPAARTHPDIPLFVPKFTSSLDEHDFFLFASSDTEAQWIYFFEHRETGAKPIASDPRQLLRSYQTALAHAQTRWAEYVTENA